MSLGRVLGAWVCMTATPLWFSLLARLCLFGVVDLQHKGEFNGAQQGGSEIPAF